jgi:hypothetical protein
MEYMEKHSVARLIGAPAGHVGYDEGGQSFVDLNKRLVRALITGEVAEDSAITFTVQNDELTLVQARDAVARQ